MESGKSSDWPPAVSDLPDFIPWAKVKTCDFSVERKTDLDEKIMDIAAEYLEVDKRDLEENSEYMPELDAYLFWKPTRGGGAVIVDSKCEQLFLGSSYDLEYLVQAFKDGQRS